MDGTGKAGHGDGSDVRSYLVSLKMLEKTLGKLDSIKNTVAANFIFLNVRFFFFKLGLLAAH